MTATALLRADPGVTPATPTAAPPIRFRGAVHTARKEFFEGTQRVRAPEETLAIIRPYFRRLGLTRLANITGLDRIGIPTVLSVRPNSPNLSVDAGKGFTLAAAMVSAGMECIERYGVEAPSFPEFTGSWEEVSAEQVTIPFSALPLSKRAILRPTWPLRWTHAWDVAAQRDVAVPSLLVTMDSEATSKGHDNPFKTGSNGLSAGNNFLEALNGGILELIERDAVACQRHAWDVCARAIPRVRLDTITHPAVCDLLARFRHAGVAAVLFDCTVDTDVPVYMAYLFDERTRHIGIYRGYGAHLDPGIAMVRALTEAVQARLIFIAGSRDDFYRHHYLRLRQSDHEDALARMRAIPETVDARTRASAATPTFEGDVGVLLARLAAVGITQVLAVDLTPPGMDVSALRVAAPGLEGYMFDSYAPGARAKAFLREVQ
ncbi:MAG: YcaO-like family protein [Gemmatimonadaceae bacterium]|nr:YcaO-like family protein [Gemmatimonadaceae bacterium]